MDFVARARFPDRRRAGRRRARRSPRPMRPGAAASGCARAIDGRAREGRGLAPAGQRDPLRRAEGQADRADRRADRRQEAADPGRRPRRERRGGADRAGAAQPRRSIPQLLLESLYRLTDLEVRFPLNLNVLDKTRTPGVMSLKQALLAWLELPDRGAGPPVAAPDRQDRRPAGAARRLPHRLPQPRPGDRDHPHRGRAQAGDDRRVRADRPPGRGDPQHAAAAACASSRRWRSPRSAPALAKEREELDEAGREPGAAADAAEEGPGRGRRTSSATRAGRGSRKRRRRARSTGRR